MAMLAEPRRKQKWTLNPRGKHWSEDSNKFGQKMLEKMGWSSGKGLGANLDGMTEHIRCRYKNDQAGIGFSHDDRDKQWTQHQEGFNELLQKLHNGESSEPAAVESELSGKSLELKSKQSRARVHYQKFTRGKDVNKYSAKDLANIFGKKNLNDDAEEPTALQEFKAEVEEPPAEPVGSSDTSYGVMTIKGGSITDYFMNRMYHLGRKTVGDVKQEPDSDSEGRAGFGFSSVKTEVESVETEKSTPRKNISFVSPAADLTRVKNENSASNSSTFVKQEPETSNKSEETPRKRKKISFVGPAADISKANNENPASDSSTSVKKEPGTCNESEETPRKRKNNFVFENPALDITTPKKENETPRKRKNNFVFENPALDITSPKKENQTPRKRKSDFAFVNPCLELGSTPAEVTGTPKRRKSEFAFVNGGLDLGIAKQEDPTASSLPVTDKKKRKKKSKESSCTANGFTNEALCLEPDRDEAISSATQESSDGMDRRKKKSKDCPRPSGGFTNEALSLEVNRDEVVPSVSQFEVPRPCFGLANDALDLADETNGKKRVTFNETVEYDTDSARSKKKKSKNSGKLDKFEVDNEKLKKKRKKSRKPEVESVFVNEAMDVETMSQEASDNAENERKSERARKKRERKRPNLETIAEASEEDKTSSPEVVTIDESLVGDASEDFEVLSLETPKKKNKKKKSKPTQAEVENLNSTIDISEEIEDAQPESTKNEKKLKKIKQLEQETATAQETLRDGSKKQKKRNSPVANCDIKIETEVINLEGAVATRTNKAAKNHSATESPTMDKENVEVPSAENIEAPKKSKKQKKSKGPADIENGAVKIEETRADNATAADNGSQSPWDGKVRKSKSMFKTFFARSPVVHFAGSNINEIKGYGMND